MKLLLTRPAGRNDAMIGSLKQREIPFMETPLLQISAIAAPQLNQQLAAADIVIFISTNAVTCAQTSVSHWPTTAQYYAVGQATTQALAALGITAHSTPLDNQQTEGLLSLDGLQPAAVRGKRIVIVRGVGGRETLAQQLQTFGAQLQYCEVYQRQCPPYDSQTLVKSWRDFGIDTIVITSGEALVNLINLVTKENFSWLLACHIIVPSIRVEQQANKSGFRYITNAGAANDQAVLAALSL
ncbi:uroporphyrinogen-III synthase [Shewanella sp. A3A]|nr:uroporphyrinogen-III synthase [Shewanella ferrihydritica]